MLIDRLMQLIVFTQTVFRITANMQSSLVLTTERKKNMLHMLLSFWVMIIIGQECYCVKKQSNTKERNEACMGNHVL